MIEKMYRYQEIAFAYSLDEFDCVFKLNDLNNIKIQLQIYEVVKETPKGVWISMFSCDKKFVLLSAKKRFACPTKKEALESFVARKNSQMRILKKKISEIEGCLKNVDRLRIELNEEIDEIQKNQNSHNHAV